MNPNRLMFNQVQDLVQRFKSKEQRIENMNQLIMDIDVIYKLCIQIMVI